MPGKLGLIAAALTALAVVPAAADGDAVKGERVFKRCVACHSIGEDAKNKIGPILTGIVGNEIAGAAEFKYSDAFLAKKEEGFVWDEETLEAYLQKPAEVIPGTKMAFAGLPKEEDREDIIAYLKQFE